VKSKLEIQFRLPRASPSILEKWPIKTAAYVAGVGLVKGVCESVGFKRIDVAGATGGTNTDHGAKGMAVVEALKENDLVFCNIKAPDIFGHDGDALGKRNWISSFDFTVGRILDTIQDSVIAITGDHSTPCSLMDHSSDPVPLVVWGPGLNTDLGETFDERGCSIGALNGLVGTDLMQTLLGLADAVEKFGA